MSVLRKTGIVGIMALMGTLTACGGNQVKPLACTWPDAPKVAAPGWICDEPVAGVEVSATGSYQKSGAGTAFSKDMAASVARDRLARQMKVHVSNMIKRYAETTGAADSETVDQVSTSVSKHITKETLVGSRVYKSRVSPSDQIYVLVGVDEKAAQNVAKDALNTSMGNERALWQQFKAKKAQDELAAEITKIDK